MKHLAALIWLLLVFPVAADETAGAAVRVLGIEREYLREVEAYAIDSGEPVKVEFNWLELEEADVQVELKAEFFADMNPGKWVERDPLVENPKGVIIKIGKDFWNVAPSETMVGKIMFRQLSRLGNLTFVWADNSGSFIQPDLHIALKGIIANQSAKNEAEQDGAGQPATAQKSKSEGKENSKPESEVRPQ